MAAAWVVGTFASWLLLGALVEELAMLVAGGLVVAGLVAYLRDGVRRAYLHGLGFALLGYAVLGRGFAYWGFPPLFVGEIFLLMGVVVLLARGDLIGLLRQPLVWLVLAFMAVGAVATLPYLREHGVDAARDAAQWGYATFALVVAGLVRDPASIRRVVGWYRGALPWLLVGPVAAFVVRLAVGDQLPFVPFSEQPVVDFKAGDVAVHLVGVLGFVVLGLHRAFLAPGSTAASNPEWRWWVFWFGALITTMTARASFVTLALSMGLLFLLRPTGRWWRLVVVSVSLLAVPVTFDIEVTTVRDGRPISASGVFTTVRSIFGSVDTADFDGTKGWRLRWWNDIVSYTLFGDYFWTGKGYGINLADADGYQVFADGSLRSPHNGHLTLLARSGVPGAIAWLALVTALVVSLVAAFRRRMIEGRTLWAHLDLWLGAYLLAFLTNGAFDVYLEGPMGGIWFWCVVGFAIAVLREQRSGLGGTA